MFKDSEIMYKRSQSLQSEFSSIHDGIQKGDSICLGNEDVENDRDQIQQAEQVYYVFLIYSVLKLTLHELQLFCIFIIL